MSLENLLPLGQHHAAVSRYRTNLSTELIDKCVGSQIWVIMNGGKGMLFESKDGIWAHKFQSSLASLLALTTMSVCILSFFNVLMRTNHLADMVLEDVTEMYVTAQAPINVWN